ncbi:unnamed protein product [Diamesa hyperborea]
MRRVFLFNSVFIIYCVCSSLAQPCVEEISGRNGECLPIKRCRELHKNHKTPQVCSSVKRTVCCPERLPPTTTTTYRPSNRISARKCQEYSTHLVHNDTFINLYGSNITKSIDECGHSTHSLYYPTVADSREFPHMALIGYGDSYKRKYSCAGALISEKWVLSTVYCLKDEELGPAKYIQLGGNKREGNYEPESKRFEIIRAEKHKLYSALYIESQIVLFEMNEPATLSKFILPICLPQSDEIPQKTAIATGWSTVPPSTEMSKSLLKINLRDFSISNCSQFEEPDYRDFSSASIDYKNMICAGANDTCQNDPGSVLQYCSEHVYCMYIITGVIARTACNVEGVTLYTRIFPDLDWIEGFVWPNEI